MHPSAPMTTSSTVPAPGVPRGGSPEAPRRGGPRPVGCVGMSRRFVIRSAARDGADAFRAVAAAAGWRAADGGPWAEPVGDVPDLRVVTDAGTHVRLAEDHILG